MSIKIAGRETDGFLFDVHGVFYDKRKNDQIFIPLQLSLARSLLSGSGSKNSSGDDVLSKQKEYVELAHQIGSFRSAFIALGGDEMEYLQTIVNIDWTGRFTKNKELINLLEWLNSTVALGILSAGSSSMSEPICNQLLGNDWRKLFQAAVFYDTPNLPAKKPDRLAFLYTLQLMKVEPSRAAIIDDSPAAVVSAATLGMMTVYVGEKTGPADIKINRIEELRKILTLT